MRMTWSNLRLMDKAGDGGSGGGSGSLLTTPGAGGGAGNSGGNPGSGTPPASGGTPAGNPGDAGNSGGNPNQNWRSSLPEELQKEPSLQTFNDVSALAKSFIHAQRAIGADKLVIPGKHATDEDWMNAYQKLGLPKELKDYEVKLKEGPGLDKAFAEKFKETAHKAGILPHQAQKLADWFEAANATSEAQVLQMRQDKMKADTDALKTEWGAAFEQNLARAGQVVREIGDPELVKYLDQTGLGNDIQLVKLLSKVGEKYMKEGNHIGGDAGFKPKFTPKEAMAEANKIMGDFTHPYHNSQHPNHKNAVAEVQGLFEMANPPKN